MGKVTKVFNDTDAVIELKQGSANVFLLLHSLPKGKSYDIKVDESATYREYWCAVQPNSSTDRVVFSSDDCTEFSKVRIYKDNEDKYTWKGTERRGTWRNTTVSDAETPSTSIPNAETPAQASTPISDAKTSSGWQQFTGFFRKKN